MHGTCLCGVVSIELTGPTPKLYQCHCSLCRKQSGSLANAATIVDASHLHWLSGQDQITSFVKPTGFRSDFCACCGSPVPNPLRDTPYYWVPSGLFDGNEALEIVADIYLDSKARWDLPGADTARFETMPDLTTIFSLLHNGLR